MFKYFKFKLLNKLLINSIQFILSNKKEKFVIIYINNKTILEFYLINK